MLGGKVFMAWAFFLLVSVCCCLGGDIHGGVKMGVSNNRCDNAKMDLDVDLNEKTDVDYTCKKGEDSLPLNEYIKPEPECLPRDENFPRPIHKCMSEKIVYEDLPPMAGCHRPLWPVYGRYSYCPPQRWVHALEHGAAVFLYHPRGNCKEVMKLVEIAKSCLRRYIISPYKHLTPERPYAVVTYGCRLMMSSVDEDDVIDYLKKHAIKDGTEKVPTNGQYSYGILEESQTVEGSDFADSVICPPKKSKAKRPSENEMELDDGVDDKIRSRSGR